jgi:hypothetical protein
MIFARTSGRFVSDHGARGTRISWSAPGRPKGGRAESPSCPPSTRLRWVLRADDRDAAYTGLVSDLRAAASALENG